MRQRYSIDEFIQRAQRIQKKEIAIQVVHVCHPRIIERTAEICSIISEAGLSVEARPFRGKYKGRSYPESYSALDKSLMTPWLTKRDSILLQIGQDFSGQLCSFGHKQFIMDMIGNVYRCFSYKHLVESKKRSLGNLFDGTFQFNDNVTKCEAGICICPYHGILGGAADNLIEMDRTKI